MNQRPIHTDDTIPLALDSKKSPPFGIRPSIPERVSPLSTSYEPDCSRIRRGKDRGTPTTYPRTDACCRDSERGADEDWKRMVEIPFVPRL